VRSVLGSDLNPERGSEGVTDVGDGVFPGVMFKKPWNAVGLRGDVFRNVLGEIERDGRAIALLLSSHRNARRERLALVIHWNERVNQKGK
jgi:hypothetical protein